MEAVDKSEWKNNKLCNCFSCVVKNFYSISHSSHFERHPSHLKSGQQLSVSYKKTKHVRDMRTVVSSELTASFLLLFVVNTMFLEKGSRVEEERKRRKNQELEGIKKRRRRVSEWVSNLLTLLELCSFLAFSSLFSWHSWQFPCFCSVILLSEKQKSSLHLQQLVFIREK